VRITAIGRALHDGRLGWGGRRSEDDAEAGWHQAIHPDDQHDGKAKRGPPTPQTAAPAALFLHAVYMSCETAFRQVSVCPT